MNNKVKDKIICIGLVILLPLLLLGGSMVAESFETCNITQLLVGMIILTFNFINFLGILYLEYIKEE